MGGLATPEGIPNTNSRPMGCVVRQHRTNYTHIHCLMASASTHFSATEQAASYSVCACVRVCVYYGSGLFKLLILIFHVLYETLFCSSKSFSGGRTAIEKISNQESCNLMEISEAWVCDGTTEMLNVEID